MGEFQLRVNKHKSELSRTRVRGADGIERIEENIEKGIVFFDSNPVNGKHSGQSMLLKDFMAMYPNYVFDGEDKNENVQSIGTAKSATGSVAKKKAGTETRKSANAEKLAEDKESE